MSSSKLQGRELVSAEYRELSADKDKYLDRVIDLMMLIVERLKQSPVFYKGEEFTKDVYREFLSEDTTRIFGAFDGESLIGVMDCSRDGNSFINSDDVTWNIGDVFVEPSYRQKGIAESLLSCACKAMSADGIKRLWVEHGTANPNARYFWDKYFTPYTVSMIRDIDTQF